MGGTFLNGQAGFRGTLQDLVAGLETGTLDPGKVALASAISEARRGQQGRLEDEVEAWLLLVRAVEYKARSLVPSLEPVVQETAASVEEGADAVELAQRLASLETFSRAAELLREFEQHQAARFARRAPEVERLVMESVGAGTGDIDRLLQALAQVWARARPRLREVQRERMSIAAAAARIRDGLAGSGVLNFDALFAADADRFEIVVTFLALLELVRLGEVVVEQEGPFAPLLIRSRGWGDAGAGVGTQGSVVGE